jgi:uncharacterized protein
MIRFTPTHLITVDAAAAGEAPRRSISGVAVEWNQIAVVSSGEKVMFLPGSLPVDGRKPKLYMQHNSEKIIGQVVERVDTGEALMFTASISATNLGNEALTLMSDGTLSEVSVGVNVEKFSFDEQGVMVIESASFNELSVVSQPAFASSVITDVAASIPQTEPEISNNDQQVTEKETPMDTEVTPVVEAAAAVEKLWASPNENSKCQHQRNTFLRFVLVATNSKQCAKASEQQRLMFLPQTFQVFCHCQSFNRPITTFQGRRPVVDAIGARAMPQGGKVFIRPKVTTHTSIAVQSAENAALQDGTYVVSDEQVTKGTFGGFVTLSEQSIDWSTPEVIGLLLDDMARLYANATDNNAADSLASGATGTRNFVEANLGDPATWAAWVAGAATTILTGSNGNLPTHMFVAPGIWQDLLALSDTSDRPLFPQIGPMNAFGNLAPGQVNGNAFGLQVVVDRNFPSATLIVGDASGFEIFEQAKGAISIDVPSTLSRTIAFRGYFATLMIDDTKFVKATFI